MAKTFFLSIEKCVPKIFLIDPKSPFLP